MTIEKIIDESGMEIPAMNCGNCMYSHLIPQIGQDQMPLIGQDQLVCMHSPPTVVVLSLQVPGGMQTAVRTQFPAVSEQMMCHQHEVDPMYFDLITGEPLNDPDVKAN